VLKEHLWTRERCGLFDVSHMGQAALIAEDGSHETVARALEGLVPADILNIKPGQQRYSQLLADDGGILDDLMVARSANPEHDGTLYLVVNAGCKVADYAHMRARLPKGVILAVFGDKALLALQGPSAAAQLARLVPAAADLAFMTTTEAKIGTMPIIVTRAGYTGEDGYEISVNNVLARVTVSVWKQASAFMATTSTRARRRLRRGSRGAFRNAGGSKAASQAPNASNASCATDRHACASASSRKAAHRRGRAQRSFPTVAKNSARSHPAALAHASTDPSPWDMCLRHTPRPARNFHCWCAVSHYQQALSPCRFIRIGTPENNAVVPPPGCAVRWEERHRNVILTFSFIGANT
jgi:Aminomethyltransferase folate-binding domain